MEQTNQGAPSGADIHGARNAAKNLAVKGLVIGFLLGVGLSIIAAFIIRPTYGRYQFVVDANHNYIFDTTQNNSYWIEEDIVNYKTKTTEAAWVEITHRHVTAEERWGGDGTQHH
jgi:hypothetical protein